VSAPAARLLAAAAAVLCGAFAGAAVRDDGDLAGVVLDEREIGLALTHSPLPEPPADESNAVADDPAAARLGQRLFFDARLSRNGEISCSTCHEPALAFTDGRPVSKGLGFAKRNSPTLLNSAYQRWFTWDGRADSAWAQALGPLEHRAEMGGDRTAIAHLVAGDPELRPAFEELFGPLPDLSDPERFPRRAHPSPDAPEHPDHRAWLAMATEDRAAVDALFARVGKLLAAYQRRLLSRDAPFDRFVAGLRDGDPEKLAALAPDAQRGFRLFAGRGRCRTCHFGPTFSDGEFHNTGVPPLGGGHHGDPGRYEGVPLLRANPFNAAGAHSDDPDGPRARATTGLLESPETWGQFKTPSLRNVALTPPYMHEGQLASLEDVLRFYSTLEGAQTGGHHAESILAPFGLTDRDVADLVAFLESLTDFELDPELLGPP